MPRKWAVSIVVACASAALAALPTLAGDDPDETPLARIMKRIDIQTKAIRAATTTSTKFKEAGKGKSLLPAARELKKLGKETRTFKAPSEAMKKPYEKWTDLADRLVAAAEDVDKASAKGDLAGTRRAWSALNNTCTNCHGAFRPSTDDGF